MKPQPKETLELLITLWADQYKQVVSSVEITDEKDISDSSVNKLANVQAG